VDDYDETEAAEVEVTEAPPADTAGLPEEVRKHLDRQSRRIAKLQRELAESRLAAKYDPSVLSLIPDELPTEKWDEFAAKAQAWRSGTPDGQGAPEAPQSAFPEPQVVNVPVAQSGPTESERNLAAVAQGTTPAAAVSAQTPLSVAEAAALAASDPAAYQRAKQAGLIRLERLPGNS